MPCELLLSNGDVALVSRVDLPRLRERRWHRHNHGYVVGSGGTPLLHRFVMDAPRGVLVDHKNGNKLDNQRSNLRFADHSKNGQNRHRQVSSKHRITGVRTLPNGRLAVQIWCKNRVTHLGVCDSIEEAAEIRAKAELKLFGCLSPRTLNWFETARGVG